MFSPLNTKFIIKKGIMRIRIRFVNLFFVAFHNTSFKIIGYCLNKVILQNVTPFLFRCSFLLFGFYDLIAFNRGYKIMKHFKILVLVLFTTSKVYYKKHCIGVASRIPFGKLGNFGKISKMGGSRA